jgi:hypothetical protein
MKIVRQDGSEVFDFGEDATAFGLIRLLITKSKFQDGPTDAIAHNPKVNDLLNAIDPDIGDGFPIRDEDFDTGGFFEIRRSLLFQAVGRHLAGRWSDSERDDLIKLSFYPAQLNPAQLDQVRGDLGKALEDFAAARKSRSDD